MFFKLLTTVFLLTSTAVVARTYTFPEMPDIPASTAVKGKNIYLKSLKEIDRSFFRDDWSCKTTVRNEDLAFIMACQYNRAKPNQPESLEMIFENFRNMDAVLVSVKKNGKPVPFDGFVRGLEQALAREPEEMQHPDAATVALATPASSAEKLFWKTPHFQAYITDIEVRDHVWVTTRMTGQGQKKEVYEIACEAGNPWIRGEDDHEPIELSDDMKIKGRPNNIAINPHYVPATALTMHAALWKAVCPSSWK